MRINLIVLKTAGSAPEGHKGKREALIN